MLFFGEVNHCVKMTLRELFFTRLLEPVKSLEEMMATGHHSESHVFDRVRYLSE